MIQKEPQYDMEFLPLMYHIDGPLRYLNQAQTTNVVMTPICCVSPRLYKYCKGEALQAPNDLIQNVSRYLRSTDITYIYSHSDLLKSKVAPLRVLRLECI
jgi:hypothetical protein